MKPVEARFKNGRAFWKDAVGAENAHGVRRKLDMCMVKNATEVV